MARALNATCRASTIRSAWVRSAVTLKKISADPTGLTMEKRVGKPIRKAPATVERGRGAKFIRQPPLERSSFLRI